MYSSLDSYSVFRVSGPNSEHEWAREGRRIIPLLRRATPINAFSPVANKSKSDLENYNRMLKSPLETRTPKKCKTRPPFPSNGTADCPDLSDMVYKTENGDVRVKPPPISVSPLPQKFKALQVLNKCLFILIYSDSDFKKCSANLCNFILLIKKKCYFMFSGIFRRRLRGRSFTFRHRRPYQELDCCRSGKRFRKEIFRSRKAETETIGNRATSSTGNSG